MKEVVFIFLISLWAVVISETPEEKHGVKYADNCEACKILAIELDSRLSETGKTHEVIDTGYSFDTTRPKKRIEYRTSELRLEESLEGLCERILEYNIHKERKDSTRFAKGMSQTFQALHGLVDKGVKVELGIPYELWDSPSAEISNMKTKCETLVEEYEQDISDWYFKHQQDAPLIKYLCEDRALKGKNTGCLYEVLGPETKEEYDEAKKNKRKIEKDDNEPVLEAPPTPKINDEL